MLGQKRVETRKSLGKHPLGRPTKRWNDIKMDLKETQSKGQMGS
jgi:hypothetical protein